MWCLLFLLIFLGCAKPPEDALKQQTTIFYVDNETNLPTCTSTNLGYIYYIKSTDSFKYCDGFVYSAIDLKGEEGAKGDTGDIGPSYSPIVYSCSNPTKTYTHNLNTLYVNTIKLFKLFDNLYYIQIQGALSGDTYKLYGAYLVGDYTFFRFGDFTLELTRSSLTLEFYVTNLSYTNSETLTCN